MSRSPYYPRRRARVQQAIERAAAQAAGASRPVRIGPCIVCDYDLPIVCIDGLHYVQAPLECMGTEAQKAHCPWRLFLEAGATEERFSALSLDPIERAVPGPSVGGEDVV